MNILPGAMVGFGAAVVFDKVEAEELVSCNVVSGSEHMKNMIRFSDHLKWIIHVNIFSLTIFILLRTD